MKYLFVFLIACLSFNSFGQNRYHKDSTTTIDNTFVLKSTKKAITGLVYTTYDNGQLKYESSWKDGVVDGRCRSFHENGQPRGEQNFKNGKRHGIERKWYENGQLEYEWNHKDETLWVGQQRWWYDNGQLWIEKLYDENGKQNGIAKSWYASGQLKYEMKYKADTLISQKCWDEDGNVIQCPE